jgi:phosphoribosyl 1,2-cyclic phosphate phosphodiesterase
MPEVIVLGSGTSNGVPTLGVQYPPEFIADPCNHRTRSSILIQSPTGNVLVDCSPELRLQVTREGIYDIDAVIVTHTHADHVMGMDDLRSICLKTGRAVPVYTLPRYQEDIRRIFNYAFREFPAGVFVPRFDLFDCPAQLEVAGLTIQTFEVIHGKIPVIGVRINDFAYITDVSEIPADVWPLLGSLDTVMLDAVRYEPHPNHFHYDKAIEVGHQIGAKRTIFTHLSHDYDHGPASARLPKSFELAYDGMRIQI